LNISVIIFCYNEAGNIARVIKKAKEFLDKHSFSYEVIIVDDGSTDGSLKIINDLKEECITVRIIHHRKNLGIGQALYSGYRAATKEFVCAIPGDGQFDINELSVVKRFSENMYYSFYRQSTDYSIYRKSLTWLNRLFNQHILGVYLRDVNWIKVYHKKHIEMVKPELRSSLIESEICAKLYKLNIFPLEIPSTYQKRNFGNPKGGNWKTLRMAIVEVTKLWWLVFRS
jgi:glycosyltransferase involved in cell wall biosynthesis